MTPNFQSLHAWSDYQPISMHEFATRFPQVIQQINDAEAFCEEHRHHFVIVIDGDIHISQEQFSALWSDKHEHHTKVVIRGNLQTEHCPINLLYVQGDLYCETMYLDDSILQIDGTVHVQHFVSLAADNHGAMLHPPALRIQTPLLFSWFYDISDLTLSPETIIFMQGEDGCGNQPGLPNLVFAQHQEVYVLKPELLGVIGDIEHDSASWDISKIAAALYAGQSIFLDGFTVESIRQQRQAEKLLAQKNYHGAWLQFKKAAQSFPAYYLPWFGMGEALRAANAFEQALTHYEAAVVRFPTGQTGLVNYAADYGAKSALRCRHLEKAFDLATASLQHNHAEREDSRANAYRFRAEALYLLGKTTEAMLDLNRALALNTNHATANWLKGLLHYRQGEQTLAEKYHQKAQELAKEFMVSYDEADCTDFLTGEMTRVNWD